MIHFSVQYILGPQRSEEQVLRIHHCKRGDAQDKIKWYPHLTALVFGETSLTNK